MNSPKTWHDLIPAITMETDKENLLLRHIMDFHIHPVDSIMEEPGARLTIPETSGQEGLKLEAVPRSKSWRRLSEGSIILANKGSPKLQHFQDFPQHQPANRLWLQSPTPDHDTMLAHYPVRNPALRMLNMEKAYPRGRSRVPGSKAMQRLNISPVRTEPNRKPISKLFIPPKMQCVHAAVQGNRRSSDAMNKLELTSSGSQSSGYGYVDLSQIRVQRNGKSKNVDPRPVRDALVGRPHDVSYSQTSSEESNKPRSQMSIVTISADTELRKVICAPEVLCEPKRIATKHLRNCMVTYTPEDGRRFVSYVPDNVSQADTENKDMGMKIVSREHNKSDSGSSFRVDDQPTNLNKIPEKTKAEQSDVNLDDSNQGRPIPKFINKKGTLNTRRVPLKSLTSRAIPIDSPDLKPVCTTTTRQIQTTQTKGKFIRRKEPVPRQFSTGSSYAPSFPDSTIMAHIHRAGIARGNLKFNRIWTNHQKSYVTDPVNDFRKEVKRMIQTSQGYHLKPRVVQAPSGHPKIIACHIPNTPSTSHAAVRYIEDRNRGRQIEPAPLRVSKGKNYAVVLPNVHRNFPGGLESPPIYVVSSPSTHGRQFHNEMDA